jgi:tyrosyl-tRNA synthetase
MGKTQKGAVWLDEKKTSPYDFYQYWRNVEDADVENCLKLLTFLPLSEIAKLVEFKDERINAAKEKLAFELTKMVHGETAANDCQLKAKAAFSGDADNMPKKVIPLGVTAVADILVAIGAAPSKGEAKRLIEGGGIKIDDVKVEGFASAVSGRPRIVVQHRQTCWRPGSRCKARSRGAKPSTQSLRPRLWF